MLAHILVVEKVALVHFLLPWPPWIEKSGYFVSGILVCAKLHTKTDHISDTFKFLDLITQIF